MKSEKTESRKRFIHPEFQPAIKKLIKRYEKRRYKKWWLKERSCPLCKIAWKLHLFSQSSDVDCSCSECPHVTFAGREYCMDFFGKQRNDLSYAHLYLKSYESQEMEVLRKKHLDELQQWLKWLDEHYPRKEK